MATSNEDRIRGWRSRRQGGNYTVGAGVSEWRLDPAALFDSNSSPAVLFKPLLARLQGEPHDSVAARRAVYDAIQSELDEAVVREGADEMVADFSRRRLRLIVRLLEHDIRTDVDVFKPGYMPAKLVEEDLRLNAAHERRVQRRRQEEAQEARRHASRNDIALEIALAPAETGDLAILRDRMRGLHLGHTPRHADEGGGGVRTLFALLIYQLQVMHGESRFALVWALIGPVVLLTLITSMYIILGTHYIMGMDVLTFSMVGATTWIMFRQVTLRTSTAYVSARGLLNLPGVTPLMCAVVHSFLYTVVYLVVFGVLISAGHALNLVTLPDHVTGFLMFVVSMGVFGGALGVLFGAISTTWRFFLRVAPIIERFLQLFSSVFLVSEQLPEQYRPWVLWSPLAHGMQLLRSAYFTNYTSQDARLGYFLIALVFMIVIAWAAQRLVRSDVQPM